MSSNSDLSLAEHIVIEILPRFPVKSLMRLKCVCKKWQDLIQSSFQPRNRSWAPSFPISSPISHSFRSSEVLQDMVVEWPGVPDLLRAPLFFFGSTFLGPHHSLRFHCWLFARLFIGLGLFGKSKNWPRLVLNQPKLQRTNNYANLLWSGFPAGSMSLPSLCIEK